MIVDNISVLMSSFGVGPNPGRLGRGNLMEQLAPRHQSLKRHEASSWAPPPAELFAMTFRPVKCGSSSDTFSCRRASTATGVCSRKHR